MCLQQKQPHIASSSHRHVRCNPREQHAFLHSMCAARTSVSCQCALVPCTAIGLSDFEWESSARSLDRLGAVCPLRSVQRTWLHDHVDASCSLRCCTHTVAWLPCEAPDDTPLYHRLTLPRARLLLHSAMGRCRVRGDGPHSAQGRQTRQGFAVCVGHSVVRGAHLVTVHACLLRCARV